MSSSPVTDSPSVPPGSARQIIEARDIDFYYGPKHALKKLGLSVLENEIMALIGPSGCGKSTFLRCINRMNDLIEGTRFTGALKVDGQNIYDSDVDVVRLRKEVGMVFQKPNPFPMSIFDNVAFGPRIHGVRKKADLESIVEQCLRGAYLWDEVKEKLKESGLSLSGGQQQRLCIARTIAVGPKVILMDEPCSALDPIATSKIEELMFDLKKEYTIVIVTHNMQQAQRVSDKTAYFLMGEMVETAPTKELFLNPKDQRTEDYIAGRFG